MLNYLDPGLKPLSSTVREDNRIQNVEGTVVIAVETERPDYLD